jgi:hypothetical protein
MKARVLRVGERPDGVGLREGSFVECDDQVAVLRGPFSARVFRRGHEPVEVAPQADLRQLA